MVPSLVVLVSAAVLCAGAPTPQVVFGGGGDPVPALGLPLSLAAYPGHDQVLLPPPQQALDGHHLVLLPASSGGVVLHPGQNLLLGREAGARSRNVFRQQQFEDQRRSDSVGDLQALQNDARSSFGEHPAVHGMFDNVIPVGTSVLAGQEVESGARSFFRQQTSLGSSADDHPAGRSLLREQQLRSGARSFSHQQAISGELDSNAAPVGTRVAADQEVTSGARSFVSQQGSGRPGGVVAGQEVESRGRNLFFQQSDARSRIAPELPPSGRAGGDVRNFPGQQPFGGQAQLGVVVGDDSMFTQDDVRAQHLLPRFPGVAPGQEPHDAGSNGIAIEAFDETRFRSGRPMGDAGYQGELRYDRPESSRDSFMDGRVVGLESSVPDSERFSGEITGDLRLPAGMSTSFAGARSGQQQYSVSFEGSGFGYGYSVRGDIGSSSQQSGVFSGSSTAPPVLLPQ